MGKKSRIKKIEKKYDCKIGFVRKPSWEDYEILEVNPDAIIAKRKGTDSITVFTPIMPAEYDYFKSFFN